MRRASLSPHEPWSFFNEDERDAAGNVAAVSTIFLTNRECPWHCIMCDLWKNTLTETVPRGAIPAQIEYALSRLPRARTVKLYNSGSFFDRQAIPPDDYPAIATLLTGFERVIVESHPALIGQRCFRFRELIEGKLEVAMGLETVHPEALARLDKHMTLEQFSAAARDLTRNDIDLRAFILLRPPFLSEDEGLHWARKSLDFAFAVGAAAAAVIPARPGQLKFAPPRIETLESVQEYGIGLRMGRVFADIWDLRQFSTCSQCYAARESRLREMNIAQIILSRIDCTVCGGAAD